jgi:hypothetical protein
MKGLKKYSINIMRIFMLTKSRVTKKGKKAPSLHGGAVKATKMFEERGKSALYSMLKPKPQQKYISFD